MEERNLVVGYDFGNDYVGISCMNPNTSEIESICVRKDSSKFLIPTVIGIAKNNKEFVFGEDAIAREKDNTAMIVRNLLDRVEEGKEITLYGAKYDPNLLLEKFLKKTLLLIKLYFPNNTIAKIGITIHQINKTTIQSISNALLHLKIHQDRFLITSYDESFQNYSLYQEKDLWNNNVGLFYFNEKGMYYSQLNSSSYQIASVKNEKKYTHLITSKDVDYTSILSYSMLEKESGDKLLDVFMNVARQQLHKQMIQTIYVTGFGVHGDWINEGLIQLCNGRRVFKGENLYSRGALYTVLEETEKKKLGSIYKLSHHSIKQTLSMVAYKHGENQEIVLIEGHRKWYDISQIFHIILDDTIDLTFKLKDNFRKQEKTIVMSLHGIEKREPRMTRIEIYITSLKKDTILIQAKDLGFGEKVTSSYKVWEYEILL